MLVELQSGTLKRKLQKKIVDCHEGFGIYIWYILYW